MSRSYHLQHSAPSKITYWHIGTLRFVNPFLDSLYIPWQRVNRKKLNLNKENFFLLSVDMRKGARHQSQAHISEGYASSLQREAQRLKTQSIQPPVLSKIDLPIWSCLFGSNLLLCAVYLENSWLYLTTFKHLNFSFDGFCCIQLFLEHNLFGKMLWRLEA